MTTTADGTRAEPAIEETVHIAAPPEVVWGLVTDLTRMGEWSGQARGGRWLGGRGPAVGSRFLGHNKLGRIRWTTTCVVREFEPPRRFVFRNEQNRAQWVYELTPEDGGTRVVHRRELPLGRPAMAKFIALLVFGGGAKFDASIPPAMRQTLAGVKATAEATAEAATEGTDRGTDRPG
ncbi:MAG TPA: SRPBCC family protein [Pseudonocardiaceae bacterium]